MRTYKIGRINLILLGIEKCVLVANVCVKCNVTPSTFEETIILNKGSYTLIYGVADNARFCYKCSHKDTVLLFTINNGFRTLKQEIFATCIFDGFPSHCYSA